MKNSIIFLISLILSLHNCFAQREFPNYDIKKEMPRKEIKYKLAKQAFNLSDTTLISSKVAYVSSEYLCGFKCDSLYTIMRFFADGRVFISSTYLSYPKVGEFNDLSYGRYGRYMVKDNKITVEFYQNKQYGVMFMFAEIISTGIQFYATSYKMNALIKRKSKQGGYYQRVIFP